MESSVSKTINLTSLETAVEEAWNNNKIAYFFDTTENAATFFNYKGTLCEIGKMQLAVSIGQKTVDDLKEDVRLRVKTAFMGDTLAFDVGKSVAKFSEYFDETNIRKELFEPENIVNKDIYKKMIREEEDVDVQGNKGWFEMKPEFKVCVLSTMAPDDEDAAKIGDHLPLDRLEFIKIE